MFLGAIGILIVNISCTDNSISKDKNTVITVPTKELFVPAFNSDSAYYFVKKQVDFGPRVPNSKAHEACKNWLVNQFKIYGCTVIEQSDKVTAHDGEVLNFTNIFASVYPEAKKRILLSAHWDTRPWGDNDTDVKKHKLPIDGANDGGSGVAVILEIARTLQIHDPGVGVDFLLFDVEDYGISEIQNSFCYGSQYWSQHPTYEGGFPVFGINLDMVGDKNAFFAYEGYSNQYARHILDKVWNAAHELKYYDVFSREPSYPVIDDHLYVNQVGIPCIDIIHRDKNSGRFPDTWHTHDDGIENIHQPSLKAVGETVLRVLFKEGL